MGQCSCQLHKGKGQRALTGARERRSMMRMEMGKQNNTVYGTGIEMVQDLQSCVRKGVSVKALQHCENQCCNEKQCCKATELPNGTERVQSTTVNLGLLIVPQDGQACSMRCFSRLQAEPRCSAAFPSSTFSCNMCPCK